MPDVTTAPTVSVVTVTFNSEEFIRGCCRSVAAGAGTVAVEHLVIDNCSTDATSDVVRR